jgi:tripartite-type tricarboxylate transporter receptor subunit TctC
LAKAQPGKLNLAVGGGVGQLSGELFKSMTRLDLTNVPYKGNAPSLASVLAGETQAMFETVSAALPHIRSGKLRVLAVSSAKRSGLLPDVPSIGETVPGYDVNVWMGVSAPAGTPAEIIGKLSGEIARILKTADVQERLTAQGLEVVGSTPEQLNATIKAELETWARVVKEANSPVQ